MCLVRSWKTGLAAMWSADLLSQKRTAGVSNDTWSSLSKAESHTISQVVLAILLYSASVEEQETMLCFLDFQEISEFPKKNTKTCN